jgi:hypothetical protein
MVPLLLREKMKWLLFSRAGYFSFEINLILRNQYILNLNNNLSRSNGNLVFIFLQPK